MRVSIRHVDNGGNASRPSKCDFDVDHTLPILPIKNKNAHQK